MKKGKFIVIEGADGAGKATQAGLLMDAFKKQGIKVKLFDFPRYDLPIGQLVGRSLKGEFGDWSKLPPEICMQGYALDRAATRDEIRDALKKGYVLSNRFTQSSMAFQSAKLKSKDKRMAFAHQVDQIEFEELKIPRPDLIIYLYLPYKVSHELVARKNARQYMGKKAGKRDNNEANVAYQKAAVKTYLELAEEFPNWHVIDCAPGGELLPPEKIHAMVQSVLKKVQI